LAIHGTARRVANHVRILAGMGGIVPGAAPQKIQGGIVRDAE